MDLLVEIPGEGPLVVDYKTDALRGGDPAERMTTYETQRDLYAAGRERGRRQAQTERHRRSGPRTHSSTLRDRRSSATYDSEALAQARQRLESLVAGIRTGSFDVTAAPHRGLCLECPARERLCSHPKRGDAGGDTSLPGTA